jgi:hypothetical protein
MALVSLAGCVSAPPPPTLSTVAPPDSMRSSAPVAQTPPVFCGAPPARLPSPLLSCDAAVAAAIQLLPSDHAMIRSILFGYGCPPKWRCRVVPIPEGGQQQGYVLFYLAGSGPQDDLVVRVKADAQGDITAADPVPYPPPIANDATARQYADQALRRMADRLRERRGVASG